MERDKKFKNQNVFLIILGAVICIIYGGKDSHYWGLVESTSEEILTDVGMGRVDPDDIILNDKQRKEITNLLKATPNNYNTDQKSLLFEKNTLNKTGAEILKEVGMGLLQANKIKLTSSQSKQINDLIQLNPNGFSSEQLSLVMKKKSTELLKEVGTGEIAAESLKLTSKQLKEIRELIRKNPENYNNKQKSILTYRSGTEILTEVGYGYTDPADIKLTEKQYNEIKSLIEQNPNDYIDLQKSLLKR